MVISASALEYDANAPVAKFIPAVPVNSASKTLSSLLSHCNDLSLIKQLHSQILTNGLRCSVLFGSMLCNSYIESGHLMYAIQVFEEIPQKNQHSWNTIISGYSKNKLFSDLLHLYKRMRRENFLPDSFNLVFAINSCAQLYLSELGKSLHADAIREGLDADPYVAPSLMRLYVDLRSLECARNLFDKMTERNSNAWCAMINGYLKFSENAEAIKMFSQMQRLGLELDPPAVLGLVQMCGSICAGKEGSVFHGYCVKRRIMDSNVCLKTSIIDMYAKCGMLDSAESMFDEMFVKDVVLWSAMVSGYAQNGRSYEALRIFRCMIEEGIVPNMITFASVLQACSHMGALREGKSVNGYVVRNGVVLDVVTYTAFVDMYAKCGCISYAEKIFNEMPSRNVFSWTAMINGFGMHGLCSEALNLFEEMRSENCLPNAVTFISVLSACSHSGRVEEGFHYFDLMCRDYGITALQEHYACMVDLLGRVGQLDEALSFIEKMPVEPGAGIWGALLGVAGINKHVALAEIVAKKLFVLDPNQPDMYVLLSNAYAATENWDKMKRLRLMINGKGLQKTAGFSLIEAEKIGHRFSTKNGPVDSEEC